MNSKIMNKDGLTPEQEKFFANSQVRDENGRLLKCYHGTPTRGITHFKNSINWFTPVKEYAQEFDFFNEGDTHEVYLNCKNLFYAGNTNGNVFSPFKPTTPYKLENKVIRLIDKLNVSESEFRALIDEIDKELGFDEVDSFKKKIHDVVNKKQFRDLLVSKGYDGIKAIEANNIITYGVFYPEDIKAVTNLHPTYKKNINEETEDTIVIDDHNMSKYIHDNVFSKSLNQILDLGEVEVTNTISKKSPQFILPNGSIIDAHKYLEDWDIEGEEVHAEVLDRIFIRIMENNTDNIDFMFSSTFEFLDEFTDVYGLVRINPGTSEVENRFYCVIPYKDTKMTSYQYDKLEEFLNIGMLELNKKDVIVMSTGGEYARYYFKETFPEDIIKKIKRYYSSGRLMEEVKRVVEGEYIWFDNETPWLSVVDSYPLPKLPKTLYHGTTARNASLINKEGVIKQGNKNWAASVDGVVYLTSSIADAKEYIRRASDVDDSQIVIYEIPTSELNLSKLYIDGNEEYYWDEVSEVWDVYNFMYKGTIPIKSNKGINETLSYNRLYHKTTPMNAVEILRSNTLKAGGTYNNNAVNGKCICFSRDYNFIENMPGKSAVIFVINKNKLASRYKITPITDYKNFFKPAKTRFKENSKAEEICQQDITDILNYVDKILVTDNIYDDFIEDIKDLNIDKEIIKQSEFKINEELTEDFKCVEDIEDDAECDVFITDNIGDVVRELKNIKWEEYKFIIDDKYNRYIMCDPFYKVHMEAFKDAVVNYWYPEIYVDTSDSAYSQWRPYWEKELDKTLFCLKVINSSDKTPLINKEEESYKYEYIYDNFHLFSRVEFDKCSLYSQLGTPIKVVSKNKLDEAKEDQLKFEKIFGKEFLDDFLKLKNRLKSPENDMSYWQRVYKEKGERETFKQLNIVLNNAQNIKSKSQIDKEAKQGATLIYSDNDWKVYKIDTYAASARYGKGTKWCISGNYGGHEQEGEYWFNYYKREGAEAYYFFIGKQEKYCLVKYPDKIEIFNEEDKRVAEIPDAPHIENVYELNADIFKDEEIIDAINSYTHSLVTEYVYESAYCLSDVDYMLSEFQEDMSLHHFISKVILEGIGGEYPEIIIRGIVDINPEVEDRIHNYNILQIIEVMYKFFEVNYENIFLTMRDYLEELFNSENEVSAHDGSNDEDEDLEESLNNTEKEVLVESKQDWDKFREWCGDDLFNKFMQVKNRLANIKLPNGRPATDIYFWMKHGEKIELEKIIHNAFRITEHDRKAREGAKLLYNNNGWKVYEISTPEASMKYGKGTQWCISGRDAYEFFDDDDVFYFYIYGDTKYAVAPNFSGNGYTIYNEVDDRVAYIPNAPQVPNLPDVSSFDPDVVRGITKLYKIKASEIESIEPVDSEYLEFFWDYDGPEHYTVTLKNGDVKYCTTSNVDHEYIDLTDEFLDWLAEY